MLASCISAELLKLRRAPIWLAFAALPAVSALIGSANYVANLGLLTPGWENLWTQHTLFICYFFLPALIGAGASYLWRLEHEGSNWNELMVAPVPARDVFVAKLAVLVLLDLVAFAAMTAFFVASGIVLHVPGAFPVASFAEQVVLGWLGSLAICGIQLVVSMLVRSFAAPVGVGLGGGILGIMASMGGFGYVFPYSLMQSGMNSNALVVLDAPHVAQIAVLSIAYVVAAVVVATVRLTRADVHA